MNIVLPATLMLDWWDELLRVAGSSTLGWVTASLVLANTDHLRYRRGEALAHQASCLHPVTNAVMVWNTVYMAAAVEQLNAFSGGVGLQVDQNEHSRPHGHSSRVRYPELTHQKRYEGRRKIESDECDEEDSQKRGEIDLPHINRVPPEGPLFGPVYRKR